MKFNPLSYLVRIAGGYFSLFAGSASIISLLIILLRDKVQLIVALLFFIAFLLICFLRLIWFTDSYLKLKAEQGYYKLATIVKYSTKDGRLITYDIQKYIQCKQLIMDKHEHDFYWTGTKDPKISSNTMIFESIKPTDNHYKKAIFRFTEPLVYNSVAIAHINMLLDDNNGVSQPYVSLRVKEQTKLITFKIELLHKRENVPDAKLYRSKMGIDGTPFFEFLENVPFNTNTYSYEHNSYNPEIGYSYKLEWQK